MEEVKTYKKEIEEKYTNEFNQSIMVDDQDTKTKNEILRKIKFFKKKKNRLPDFIREERIKILTKRKEDEKAMLLSKSQTSLDDEEMRKTINQDPVNINIRNKQANDFSDGATSPLTKQLTRRKTLTNKQSFMGREVTGDLQESFGSPQSKLMRAVDSKQYLSPEGSLEGGYEYKTES